MKASLDTEPTRKIQSRDPSKLQLSIEQPQTKPNDDKVFHKYSPLFSFMKRLSPLTKGTQVKATLPTTLFVSTSLGFAAVSTEQHVRKDPGCKVETYSFKPNAHICI